MEDPFNQDLRIAMHSSKKEIVYVDLDNGVKEAVQVDPENGPIAIAADGREYGAGFPKHRNVEEHTKNWGNMGRTEKEVLLHQVARMNRQRRDRFSQTGFPPQQEHAYIFNWGWDVKWFANADVNRENKTVLRSALRY
mmetsp:Transcript_132484/g.215706  ORF Transcript_132484/g.215706 Transcript_132484/m.215706 type:complete len:138 (-) Transcript_132484:30-443(-)